MDFLKQNSDAIPTKQTLPSKLKSDCINQLDQLLTVLGSTELMAVDLLPKIVEGHLATSLVLNKLEQNDDLHMAWVAFKTLEDGIFETRPLLCITQNGDSFLLGQKDGDRSVIELLIKRKVYPWE
jgi:hypothetical protein